jgi:hypothetical protein
MARGRGLVVSAMVVSAWVCVGSAQVLGPKIEASPIPAGVDPFNLSFDEIRKHSAAKGFELVGHSYFKVPERAPWAKAQGRPGPEVGSGFNTVRVYDGIAYLAGYNSPQTLFGVLIADVRDPRNMKPLSFVPCRAGTRCNYLRVNREKKILILNHDGDNSNPTRPPAGQMAEAGVSFHDVSNPARPREIAFVRFVPNGAAHGLDADDRYAYSCGQFSTDLQREALSIIDYSDPANIRQVATWHVPGMLKGEQFGPLDRLGPDGKPQIIQCHEIVYYNDRLYAAWRDTGMVILDVKDRTKPALLATFDYVPPFHGGNLGAAHTSLPVVVKQGEHPDLVVHTDEIFDCPPGFGRILDVSDLKAPDVVKGQRPANVVLLSTFRLDFVADRFEPGKPTFVCPDGPGARAGASTHLPVLDRRSPSLVYINWYDEGLHVLDISNPFAPVFVAYFLSPVFPPPATGVTGAAALHKVRHTREIFQDPDTNLLYLTDGNGGGLMVLRYTGPMPTRLPIPGAR